MLSALTILLVFQLIGEVLAQLFALPVPGPVIGMALLFAALALRGGPSPELRDTAQRLLQHLSLLFVPAGVASHGIGIARAFQVSEQAGAFSGLAMGLNALLTALLVPLLMPLLKTGSRACSQLFRRMRCGQKRRLLGARRSQWPFP